MLTKKNMEEDLYGQFWKETYTNVKNAVTKESKKDIAKQRHHIEGFVTGAREFFALYDNEQNAFSVGSTSLFRACLFPILQLEVDTGVQRVRRMEIEFSIWVMDRKVNDYEKYGATKWLLLSDKKKATTPVIIDYEYVWCCIFAHLHTVAMNLPVSSSSRLAIDPNVLKDEAAFICAKYVGDQFTVFANALLCVNEIARFLPPSMKQILEIYLQKLSTFCPPGKLPFDFIHPF